MSTDARGTSEHSIGQLVSGVTTNVSSLVRLEIELAKAELSASVKQGATGGGLAAIAAAVSVMALIMLSVAAAFGLATWVPTWAGFAIVGGVYLLIAAILLGVGIKRLKRIKGLARTQASVAETKSLLGVRSTLRTEAKAAGLSVQQLADQRAADEARLAAQQAAREAARQAE